MIDKVELRIPRSTQFSIEFDRLHKELNKDPKGPFRQAQHYLRAGDLRGVGYPVILHMFNLHDRVGNHKLEVIETGRKSYSQIAREIQRIFEVQPASLETMRIDLAADVKDVPVAWFLQNIRAKYKRWTASFEALDDPLQCAAMGKRGVETIYFGKRPNLIRIYDKVAQRRDEYSKLIARAKREDAPAEAIPIFEQIYGHPREGFTLTRVEHQIPASRVPSALSTFGLLRRAADFDPFQKLVFVGVGQKQPSPDNYEFSEYAQGFYLRWLVEQEGAHRARQIINRCSKRNANRIFQKYSEFLPADGCLVSPKSLYERYRDSVLDQLAA